MPSIYSGGETDVGSITSASILTSPRKKISLSRATEGVSLELHAELATTKRLDLYKLEVEAQLGETSRG
jgi:hypothetical protein